MNVQRRGFLLVTLAAAAATPALGQDVAPVAWPLAARAQQPRLMRRIGVLMFQSMDDPVGQSDVAEFQQALQELGWTEGRNVTIDYRWGAATPPAFAHTRRSWSRSRLM